jgi:hypothetical protein
LSEGDPKVNCFRKDAEVTLWFNDILVLLKKEVLKKMIMDEAHTLSTLFIWVVPRCIMT